MIDTRHYHRELEYLRSRAAEFSRAHPAVAPLLSGPSSDPDVERLLEGTAYLVGELAQQLDESYDLLAENLLELVLPQLLRDIPSCTVMQFTPKPSLSEILVIPKGSRMAADAIEGVSCIFSTISPVELAPLRLDAVTMDSRPGRQVSLRLDFVMTAPQAFSSISRLRLHLHGSRPGTLQRLYILLRHTARLLFHAGQAERALPASALRPVGLEPEEGLFPYPATALPCYRLLQEYYIFPEKFFFLDIQMPNFATDGKGVERFSCTIELRQPGQDELPAFTRDDFALFATPAVNLFPYETIPIRADHRQENYLVRANTSKADAYVPYLIESVKGVGSGAENLYSSLLAQDRDPSHPFYKTRYLRDENGRREMELLLSYPPDGPMPETDVLSLNVLYSNGDLPSRLKIGDVRLPLSSSPTMAEFANLTQPTPSAPAPAQGNALWSMLAHLHLNYLPLADAETLRAMLLVYLPKKTDALIFGANKKRIDSILSLDAKVTDYIWKGRPVRGTDLTLTLDESGFSNTGDMYFFAMIIASFLHEYSSINSFVSVTATDNMNKNRFRWLKHMKNLVSP
ncbi:MAG: type VI secretion system baseplate subunit TssF [Desulfovibrio sp.]|jgi:type VI secretion system protein ImpG|nr:type VI secretion system baseplate subunit TssF [Desulfovibrio sp.]